MSLKLSALRGQVVSLLVNQPDGKDFVPQSVNELQANYSGFAGDAHAGLTRKSCVRVKDQYAQGTEIRNVRQISILSVEELDSIAAKMELEELKPEWLIANLVVSGIPDFTLLPPSTRLIFPSGAALVIDMENGPCAYPGSIIEQVHPDKGKIFARFALKCRGVTAWVEREGSLSLGDRIAVHVPVQAPYPNNTVA